MSAMLTVHSPGPRRSHAMRRPERNGKMKDTSMIGPASRVARDELGLVVHGK